MIDSVIFDLDGTLWDSSQTVAESWSGALAKLGIERVLTTDDLRREMGKTMDVIMADFFPDMPEQKRFELMPALCEEETRLLEKKGGVLYPGVAETLEELSKSYRLFIVSNCQQGYIEAFIAAHGFSDVFEGHLCWGDTGLVKSGTNKKLVEKYGLRSPVYVGDTQGDKTSAEEAGIPFLHAAYGFGEISGECPRISAFAQLPGALKGF